jgi:hypothetical protein
VDATTRMSHHLKWSIMPQIYSWIYMYVSTVLWYSLHTGIFTLTSFFVEFSHPPSSITTLCVGHTHTVSPSRFTIAFQFHLLAPPPNVPVGTWKTLYVATTHLHTTTYCILFSYLLPWSHFPQPCYSPSSPRTLLIQPFT